MAIERQLFVSTIHRRRHRFGELGQAQPPGDDGRVQRREHVRRESFRQPAPVVVARPAPVVLVWVGRQRCAEEGGAQARRGPDRQLARLDEGLGLIALSYGRDRPEAMSIQTGCQVLDRAGPVALTDCEATPGVSGAPLLRQGAGGPELLAVIVAALNANPPALRGQALAVEAGPLIDALRAELARTEAAR